MALGRKHRCVQPAFLQEIRTENGQRDPNNSCVFPLHTRLGRTNNPCSSAQLLPFWEGDAGRECQPEASPDFFHPAFSAQHMASQNPSPPLLSRAHLCLPKLHTKSAGVQVHSECIPLQVEQGMLPGIQPADTLLHTRLCLENNPLASTLPSAKGGRLCIKGSVLKREEYFPMKNQHPHKTKS